MIRALPWRILTAALLLAAMLVSLVISESRARAAGREILLPMEAVDPRSLLTGHYSALRLTQALAPDQACPARSWSYREGGWISLKDIGGQHRFVAVTPSRAAAQGAGGDVVLRGGVYCARMALAEGEQNAVTLDIGVTRFHADQQEAQAMDKALAARRPGAAASAFAAISVGEDGRARLKGVVIDGKRTDLTWW
jgi:hypothetical protein